MSKLGPNQMTVRKLESLKDGDHCDGGNLWISVAGKTRIWSVGFKSPVIGKRREMGIGDAREGSLAEARLAPSDVRKQLRNGIDPIDACKLLKAARLRQSALTFGLVASGFIEDQKAGWRDPRLPGIWMISLKRGGRTSKIHALANMQGKPIAFVLTPGNIAEISVAAALLDEIAAPKRLPAKAYDADHLRKPLEAPGTEIVIPYNGTRRRPYPLNRIAYRRRNVIERMFCRMKDWRSIAARSDRLARNLLSAVALVAAICFWLT